MPRGIGKLVSLQELSVFVVGKQDRVEHCASISELEHLKLVGQLRIKGLENVTSPVDAKAANLIEKNLRSLKLEWNVLSAEEAVLENLQPHQKLENLEIGGYGGGKFPSWMMNRIGSCLPNLVKIKLANMPGCSSLPQLGQLPFLEELTIRNMPAVTNLGVDKFPALTTLELSSMPELREWVTVLTVDDEEGRRERVPFFRVSLNCGLKDLTCLPESLRGLTSLQRLRISDCEDLERIEDWLGELSDLQSLEIWECSSLRYLPAHKMTTLQELDINKCPLLFDADGRFVDTSVDHIKNVEVDGRKYPYKEQASSSPHVEKSSPKEEKEKKIG
uniref:R13L1/DRL21-like LRR repeat region domain-containing protein n=1 Tax=Ananas comosus var. bracteatus TaxID=296719 RepID=A0A6V7PEJ0_ANACO|nr:unnamed protein product [Ananas comosus var. bracteatus]